MAAKHAIACSRLLGESHDVQIIGRTDNKPLLDYLNEEGVDVTEVLDFSFFVEPIAKILESTSKSYEFEVFHYHDDAAWDLGQEWTDAIISADVLML